MGMKPKKAKQGQSPMDAALAYLTAKPRTVREVEEKLDALDFGEGDVIQTMARLVELDLVDDERFAADFVSTRLATKPLSRRKLREQLYARKLPGVLIDEAMAVVDDAAEEMNARRVAEKYVRQFACFEGEEQKRRVIKRLMGRGFAYEAMSAALEAVFGDAQGLADVEEGEEDDED